MTRGTLYLVTDEEVLESTEFNGNMFPEGLGDEAMEGLEKCESAEDFKDFVEKFNEENHGYEDVILVYTNRKEDVFDDKNYINFNRDYFGRFFSDYTFWKNLSSETIIFFGRDGIKAKIKPGETIRFKFGHINF